MLINTQSYLLLREYIQESLDYAYLTCHAVPALNAYMKAVDHKVADKIPDPDHFGKPGGLNRLREIKSTYKETLGRFMLISAFSHFESYIQDVVNEIFRFHGGITELLAMARRRSGVAMRSDRIGKFPDFKPLNETRKRGKDGKYQKCIQILEGKCFVFPSQMTSAYGIKKLADAVSKSGFRAARINEIVFDALGLPHDQSMEENIARIREIRNDIAHGRRRSYQLKTSIEDLKLLRQYALAIDQHILTYFMIIENA
jgi:hypothetical protein